MSGLLLDIIPPVVRAVRDAMRTVEGSQLTIPQFRVLGYVSLQSCTNKQIADWHGVSLPAMSRMVDCLVRRGLLIRAVDPADRRQVRLELNKKGREEFERMRLHVQAMLADRLGALSKTDKASAQRGLAALKELFDVR